MLQQDSLSPRFRSIRTAFVWVAVALLMSIGTVHAASIGVSDNATDHAVSGYWEFVHGHLVAGCVMPNGDLWIGHPSQEDDLEAATGETATVQALSEFIDALPQAGNGDVVRFEGGQPCATSISELAAKGYDTPTSVTPSPGFNVAVEYTP